MREIKFRAWHKKNGVMLSWEVMQKQTYTSAIGIECSEFSFKRWGEVQEDFILMQYTGLKDKNGKEIYEGDIMDIPSWTRTKKGKIRKGLEDVDKQLRKDYGRYCVIEWSRTAGGGFTGSGLAFYDTGKVIGNIYENPELLDTI